MMWRCGYAIDPSMDLWIVVIFRDDGDGEIEVMVRYGLVVWYMVQISGLGWIVEMWRYGLDLW